MITPRRATATAIFFTVMPSSCQAAPALLQAKSPAHTKPAKPASQYKLVLSLGVGWNTNYTGLPITTVTFVNPSLYTLMFALDSSFSSFTVEYQQAKEALTPNADWEMLKSNIQSSLDVNSSDKASTFTVIGKILPKQSYKSEYDLVGFPMSAKGFYRITAFSKIPNVAELSDSLTSPTVIRRFDLDVRSNSIVIRRTATGFVTVDAVTKKQLSPK